MQFKWPHAGSGTIVGWCITCVCWPGPAASELMPRQRSQQSLSLCLLCKNSQGNKAKAQWRLNLNTLSLHSQSANGGARNRRGNDKALQLLILFCWGKRQNAVSGTLHLTGWFLILIRIWLINTWCRQGQLSGASSACQSPDMWVHNMQSFHINSEFQHLKVELSILMILFFPGCFWIGPHLS